MTGSTGEGIPNDVDLFGTAVSLYCTSVRIRNRIQD